LELNSSVLELVRLMHNNRHFVWLLFLLVSVQITMAQTGISLPLQSEKLAIADSVKKEAIAKKDTTLMAEAYYLYGKIHVDAGDYLTAKQYFIKSLRIVEQRHQFDKISRIYARLSWLEREQSNLAKQLEYAQISLNWARRSTPKAVMAACQSLMDTYLVICHDSLAVYGKHSLQDSLFYYAKTAEKIAHKLNDSVSIAGISLKLGKVYGLLRDPQAFHFYQTALRILTAQKKTYGQVTTSQHLAETYLHFAKPDKAYPLLERASILFDSLKTRDSEVEKNFASLYMNYYVQKENWQMAYEQSLKVQGYERDRMLADRDGAVSRLSFEYDNENKGRELKLSQQNQRTQRWLLVVLTVLFLGAAATSVAFYWISLKNQRLSQQNATLVQEQNHRVKNNLQLISSLLSLQSSRLDDESARIAVEDSQRRIEVMSLLQRKLYEGNNLVEVNVAEFVQELVEMVLKAFEGEHVAVEYKIEPLAMLPVDSMTRVGLIINELVTNACKYAFPDNPQPVMEIAASISKRTFHLTVTDNGPGFNHSNVPSRSFGLRLIKMQVEQLFGTYRFENKVNFQFSMTFNLFPPFSFR
jgi:two-component sensor histidine kinase